MPRGDKNRLVGIEVKAGKGAGCGAGPGVTGRMGRRVCGQPGECVCPECGTKTPHGQGIPCTQQKCPQCGTSMMKA